MKDMFQDVKYIHTASIPVIKVFSTEEFGSKKIDITLQDGKHNGMKCVTLVENYLETFKHLRYLVLAFKQLIFNGQLNDPFQGGLSSYGLILMIVAYLQFKICNQDTMDLKSPNLGVVFLEILNFYSFFENSTTEIVPFKPEDQITSHPFKKITHNSDPMFIWITDPLNPQNNVAKSMKKFYWLKVRISKFRKAIFSNSFFSAFSLSGCEMKDEVHACKRPENEYNAACIKKRNFVLLKVFNTAKIFLATLTNSL
jgi:non-canonical poly(A) RNA polymerase PAPD5/7